MKHISYYKRNTVSQQSAFAKSTPNCSSSRDQVYRTLGEVHIWRDQNAPTLANDRKMASQCPGIQDHFGSCSPARWAWDGGGGLSAFQEILSSEHLHASSSVCLEGRQVLLTTYRCFLRQVGQDRTRAWHRSRRTSSLTKHWWRLGGCNPVANLVRYRSRRGPRGMMVT